MQAFKEIIDSAKALTYIHLTREQVTQYVKPFEHTDKGEAKLMSVPSMEGVAYYFRAIITEDHLSCTQADLVILNAVGFDFTITAAAPNRNYVAVKASLTLPLLMSSKSELLIKRVMVAKLDNTLLDRIENSPLLGLLSIACAEPSLGSTLEQYLVDPDEAIDVQPDAETDKDLLTTFVINPVTMTKVQQELRAVMFVLSMTKKFSEAHYTVTIVKRAKALCALNKIMPMTEDEALAVLSFKTVELFSSQMELLPKLKHSVLTHLLLQSQQPTAPAFVIHLKTLLQDSQMAIFCVVEKYIAAPVTLSHISQLVLREINDFCKKRETLKNMYGRLYHFARILSDSPQLTSCSELPNLTKFALLREMGLSATFAQFKSNLKFSREDCRLVGTVLSAKYMTDVAEINLAYEEAWKTLKVNGMAIKEDFDINNLESREENVGIYVDFYNKVHGFDR